MKLKYLPLFDWVTSFFKGGREVRNIFANLTIVVILIAAGLLLPREVFAAGLTDVDLGRLKQAGLSENTFVQLLGLYEDEDRKRPPTMEPAVVERMVEAGFGDDLIRMFVLLDRLTGRDDEMPVPPETALKMVRAGTGLQSIWLLVGNEVALAGGEPKVDTQPPKVPTAMLEKASPGREGDVPAERNEPPLAANAPPTPQKSPLGREVVTNSDGHKVILYHSGFPESPIEEIHVDGEGRKWLIYRAGGPGIPPAALDPVQQYFLDRALEHLGSNIDIYPSR